jgi:DNA-directed RNA polymerase subunit alpha
MEKKDKEMGVIAIDAIFSPIKKVSIDVENIRVGEMTNWDQLIINLETDGCVTPQEAFDRAVGILSEQFDFLKGSTKIAKDADKKEEKKEKKDEE